MMDGLAGALRQRIRTKNRPTIWGALRRRKRRKGK